MEGGEHKRWGSEKYNHFLFVDITSINGYYKKQTWREERDEQVAEKRKKTNLWHHNFNKYIRNECIRKKRQKERKKRKKEKKNERKQERKKERKKERRTSRRKWDPWQLWICVDVRRCEVIV